MLQWFYELYQIVIIESILSVIVERPNGEKIIRIQRLFAIMSSKTRHHTVVVAIGFDTTYSATLFSLFRFLKAKENCLNQIATDN